ncbi:MAG: hypothetical protein ACKVOE_06250 [Rickettsiales bacterium]
MAIYRYNPGSLLDSVQIATNATGGLRAYLYAAPGASSEPLRQAKQAMRARGWKCVPIVQNGVPALEVRGFTKRDEFLKEVQQQGLAGLPTSITPEPDDTLSAKEKWSKGTLGLAGASYLLGDSAYIYYRGAPLIKEWKTLSNGIGGGKFFGALDVLAGLGYMVGSLSLARYGGRDQSVNNIATATQKVERFARKEGLDIPPESSLAFENDDPKRSVWGKIDHLVGKYPSETLNATYIGVGSLITAAALYNGTRAIPAHLAGEALKVAKANRQSSLIDVGLGVITAAAATIGLTVKETKPLPGDPKRHGLGGVIDWIKEKPLRATGIGYMIATAVHAGSTLRSKEPMKYLVGRWIFIGTNIISELLLAISSKGHGTGVKPDKSIDRSVIAAAAELILRQPSEKREAMIGQLAGYMASPEVLGGKADDIAAELHTHLNALEQNPWTKHYKFVPTAQGGKIAVETELADMPAQVKSSVPGTQVHKPHHVSAGLAGHGNEPASAMAM